MSGGGYSIQFIGDQQPNQNQNQPNQQPVALSGVNQKIIDDDIMAHTRITLAQARTNESLILLNGLAEIRFALNVPQADKDNQTGERQALKPAFTDGNLLVLQNAYLHLMERYVNLADHIVKNEYKVEKITFAVKPLTDNPEE